MRFEANSRGITRSDYEQFTRFLGTPQPIYNKTAPMQEIAGAKESSHPLAMVYGVKQSFEKIYEPDIALEIGTIFEELNKPFYPVGCKTKNREGCL